MRSIALRALSLLAICFTGSMASAQTKKVEDAQVLALEVAALRTLHRLDLSDTQLEALQKIARGTASPAPKSTGQTKLTPAFLKSMSALRTALMNDDEDMIDELRDKVLEIMEKDKIQIEDRVPISESAKRSASQVIRLLHPSQVLAYLQVFEDDEVDLLDLVEETLEQGEKLSGAEWKTLRDRAANEGAWLMAGSDDVRNRAAVKALTAMLDLHHNPATAKSAPVSVTKHVANLTNGLDPFVMLRNAMEREVAEMLSNPRLMSAIQSTLDQRKKKG
jgi:hypothetical protein